MHLFNHYRCTHLVLFSSRVKMHGGPEESATPSPSCWTDTLMAGSTQRCGGSLTRTHRRKTGAH